MNKSTNNWNTIRHKKKNKKKYINVNINIKNNIYVYKNRFDITDTVQEKKEDKFESGKNMLKDILYFPDSPTDF